MNTERKTLHAYLSAEAHRLWHETAAKEGVSVTALLEAMAGEFARGPLSKAQQQRVITAARQIDAERRRRSNRPRKS